MIHQSKLRDCMNLLAPEWCKSNFTSVFFKLIKQIDILSTAYKIGFSWVTANSIDDKLTLVQVMACCHQANVEPRMS